MGSGVLVMVSSSVLSYVFRISSRCAAPLDLSAEQVQLLPFISSNLVEAVILCSPSDAVMELSCTPGKVKLCELLLLCCRGLSFCSSLVGRWTFVLCKWPLEPKQMLSLDL